MALNQLTSQWPQQEQTILPTDQKEVTYVDIATSDTIETIKDIFTSQHPLISIQTDSGITTQNPLTTTMSSNTTESFPNIYTTMRDMITQITEASTNSTTISETPMINKFTAKDIISSVVTTETTILNETITTNSSDAVLNTFSDILTVSQNSTIEAVTDSSLNFTVVSETPNLYEDSITTTFSTVTKNILEITNDTSTDGTYMEYDDNDWIFYVIMGVIIAIVIIFGIGMAFLYKKIKQNKECSGYQVSQIPELSSCSGN